MKRLDLFLVIGAILIALSSVCFAAAETINLNFNSSHYVSLPRTITRIYIGNGNIVKVKQPTTSMNEVLITALEKVGSTNVFIWTADGARYEYNVTVSDEDVGMAAIIQREIGLPNVKVKKIGDKILLNGTVENENEHAHAVQVAQFFAKGSAPAVATNPVTGVDTTNENTKTSQANVIDGLIVLHPSQNFVEAQIEQAIDLPDVHVKKIGNSLMLTGTVNTEQEHIHAVQVATVFANNAEVPNNLESQNNVKILSLNDKDDAVREAQVSKVNVLDRIEVLNPQSITEMQIEQAIGLPDVHVKKVDERILLTGTVQNQYERNYAIQIARLYVGGGSEASLSFGSTVNPELKTQGSDTSVTSTTLAKDNEVKDDGDVIDLLQMLNPTQIRLEAQIIAIRPQDVKNLGFRYDGTGSTSASNPGVFYGGEYYKDDNDFRNNPWRWFVNSRANINYSLNALITKSKAKILSRPSIMTMSGEQATIQVGGRIPYTTITTTGTYVVERDNYGVILQLKPIVDGEGRIVSAVHAEISSLSGETVNGNPILDRRSADTVVTMDSGSTMVIGGLMDSSERKVVSKIPLLGNIPILGEFFKYTSKTKDNHELIILVTPYIVSGYEKSRAGMSDAMRDYYREGQREKNHLRDVDLNEPPPPVPAKKSKSDKKVIKTENNLDNNDTKTPEKKSGWSFGAGIFGDAF